jgi:hypothetical protein
VQESKFSLIDLANKEIIVQCYKIEKGLYKEIQGYVIKDTIEIEVSKKIRGG